MHRNCFPGQSPYLAHCCVTACDVVLRHTVGLRYPGEVVANIVLRLHREHILELYQGLRRSGQMFMYVLPSAVMQA